MVLGVALPGGVIAARRRPQVWELHATYRSIAVVLYSSSDTRVFTRSAGAARAMEDGDSHARGNGEAA